MTTDRGRRGFTLIEMLLAVALTAALGLAVLGVTASLGRAERLFEREPVGSAAWQRQVLASLRRDVRQAHWIHLDEPEGQAPVLMLAGPLGFERTDSADLEPGHTPALVRYFIEPPGLLVRAQRSLLDHEQGLWDRQLVAGGISRFQVAIEQSQADAQIEQEAAEVQADTEAEEREAASLHVHIEFEDIDAPGALETLIPLEAAVH